MKRAKRTKAIQSELRLIKRFAEFIPKERIPDLRRYIRGIYVLYNYNKKNKCYDVVYVGMARKSMKGRLKSHARSKGSFWTHFSALEVWRNIRDDEIVELEGILRHLYRKDSRANAINRQRRFKKLRNIRNNKLKFWKVSED